jgi:hypothetical protein
LSDFDRETELFCLKIVFQLELLSAQASPQLANRTICALSCRDPKIERRLGRKQMILPKKHIFNMLCWMSVGIFSIIRSIDESTGV